MGTVINFHGFDHKCGTTMLCHCLAEFCARTLPEKKVLYFNACNEHDHYSGQREYTSNYHMCELSMMKDDPYPERPEVIIDLLNKERNRYDYIFCDGGADSENPELLGCLYAADINIFAVEQNSIVLRRAKGKIRRYLRAGIPVENIVINKYASDKLITEEIVLRELDINGSFRVKNSRWSEFADEEGRCLLYYKDKAFAEDIGDLWQSLMLKDI